MLSSMYEGLLDAIARGKRCNDWGHLHEIRARTNHMYDVQDVPPKPLFDSGTFPKVGPKTGQIDLD